MPFSGHREMESTLEDPMWNRASFKMVPYCFLEGYPLGTYKLGAQWSSGGWRAGWSWPLYRLLYLPTIHPLFVYYISRSMYMYL